MWCGKSKTKDAEPMRTRLWASSMTAEHGALREAWTQMTPTVSVDPQSIGTEGPSLLRVILRTLKEASEKKQGRATGRTPVLSPEPSADPTQ